MNEALTGARFLLLQARRSDDPMAPHERQAFADALGVPVDAITPHDGLTSTPDARALRAHHAMLIGGSGDFSVTGDDPFLPPFFDFLRRVVVDEAYPTFASCFGFQALVVAGGAPVATDKDKAEVGTYAVHLTEEGHADPVFGPSGPTFFGQLGHKDSALWLPERFVGLARSDRAPHQAFRIRGTDVVATQFHPELTVAGMTARYLNYLEAYQLALPVPGQPDPVLDQLREAPEAVALLPRWAEQVFRARR